MTAYDIIGIIKDEKENGMSVATMKKLTGRHRQTIYHWLNYETEMPMSAAVAILHGAGYEIDIVRKRDK